MQTDAYVANDPFASVPEDTRVSLLAIFSLITGILCCIPGVGLIGILLGVIAMVAIGASGGRVHGKGLAITGIVLGLVASVVWVALSIGIAAGLQAYVGPMSKQAESVLVGSEAGDVAKVQAALDPALSSRVTAETLAEFAAAYTGQVGAFVTVPADLGEAWETFNALGQQMGTLQSGGQVIPFAFTFDRGPALVVVEMNPNTPPTSPNMITISDLSVTAADGTEIRFSDYLRPPGTAVPAGEVGETAAPPASDEDQDEGQDEDKDQGPADGGGP